MVEQTVLHARLAQRNLEVGLRQFLEIVGLFNERIVEILCVLVTQQMQDDLRVFRVVFVPGVVQRLARPGDRDRGDELNFETLDLKEISQVPMVVSSWFKGDLQSAIESLEIGSELSEITPLITHDHLPTFA